MDLKELESVDPATHWYYCSKASDVIGEVSRVTSSVTQIVDVGAGSGFFCAAALARYPGASAFCVDPNYQDDQVGFRSGISYVRSAPAVPGDLYLFIDVLEHVPDDVALLSSYVTEAKPGAVFALTVPAFMSLWSPHDVFLEHYRRYRLHGIEATARRAGLAVVHSRYLFGLAFAPAFVMRRSRRGKAPKSDMRPVPPALNAALIAELRGERLLRWNRIAGLSALVVARKPMAAGAVTMDQR